MPLTRDPAVEEIRRLAHSTRIRDSLRFWLAAPRFLLALLKAGDAEVDYWIDQVRRRDRDGQDAEGRLVVAIDAAAREGWRQALAAGVGEHLDLEACRAIARTARPNIVTGDVTMRRVRGH